MLNATDGRYGLKRWEVRHDNADFEVEAQTQGEAAELAAARLAPDWVALEDDWTGHMVSAFDFDGQFITEFSVRLTEVNFIPFRSADDRDMSAAVVEDAAYRAAPTCQCGNAKDSGEIMCAQCGHAEMLDYNRDHEEEARQERLLACLPDGDCTASEMAECLS